MKHLPNMKNVSKLNVDEKNLVWTKAIIDSMTSYERKKPEIINGSFSLFIHVLIGSIFNFLVISIIFLHYKT